MWRYLVLPLVDKIIMAFKLISINQILFFNLPTLLYVTNALMNKILFIIWNLLYETL